MTGQRDQWQQRTQRDMLAGIWVTDSGKRLLIREMASTHLLNCCGMLRGDSVPQDSQQLAADYLALFVAELMRRDAKELPTMGAQ